MNETKGYTHGEIQPKPIALDRGVNLDNIGSAFGKKERRSLQLTRVIDVRKQDDICSLLARK